MHERKIGVNRTGISVIVGIKDLDGQIVKSLRFGVVAFVHHRERLAVVFDRIGLGRLGRKPEAEHQQIEHDRQRDKQPVDQSNVWRRWQFGRRWLVVARCGGVKPDAQLDGLGS